MSTLHVPGENNCIEVIWHRSDKNRTMYNNQYDLLLNTVAPLSLDSINTIIQKRATNIGTSIPLRIIMVDVLLYSLRPIGISNYLVYLSGAFRFNEVVH